jgi:hypothetical protein
MIVDMWNYDKWPWLMRAGTKHNHINNVRAENDFIDVLVSERAGAERAFPHMWT